MLTIEAEATAGQCIETVVRQMVDLATRTGVRVHLQFNDVKLAAVPGADTDDMVQRFFEATKPDVKHKYVHGRSHPSPEPPHDRE